METYPISDDAEALDQPVVAAPEEHLEVLKYDVEVAVLRTAQSSLTALVTALHAGNQPDERTLLMAGSNMAAAKEVVASLAF